MEVFKMISLRALRANCLLWAAILICLGISASATPSPTLPTLETLKSIDYNPLAKDVPIGPMDYGALSNLLAACQSYAGSVDVLSSFREPVQTRGNTGIAVFRKVSPSVVLVVAAKFKDDKVTDS